MMPITCTHPAKTCLVLAGLYHDVFGTLNARLTQEGDVLYACTCNMSVSLAHMPHMFDEARQLNRMWSSANTTLTLGSRLRLLLKPLCITNFRKASMASTSSSKSMALLSLSSQPNTPDIWNASAGA